MKKHCSKENEVLHHRVFLGSHSRSNHRWDHGSGPSWPTLTSRRWCLALDWRSSWSKLQIIPIYTHWIDYLIIGEQLWSSMYICWIMFGGVIFGEEGFINSYTYYNSICILIYSYYSNYLICGTQSMEPGRGHDSNKLSYYLWLGQLPSPA